VLSDEAQTALRNFLSQCPESYCPAARRLPFRVTLSEFAKSLAQNNVQSLMGYLAMKLCAKSDMKISPNDVETIISQYPAIVILDGLDEVPSSSNREEVLSAVSSFSIDISTSGLDVLIVATTRPQGYNDEFSPSQYRHQYLVPLLPSDAMDYGRKLARIRFGSNEDRYDRVVERLQRALSKPATTRLMRTPLQVTILTLLVDRMGDPPDERWNLFKEYYQLIYERETERDILSVAVLKSNRIEVDVIHKRVGIALQVESERTGSTDARLTVEQFSQLVQDYLVEEKYEEPGLSSLKKQIIEAAANRLVFLVGLESGQVGFEIRSLQEFMAAESITDGEDRYIYDRLRAIAPSSHWRNVYLFAVGKCFSDRRYMRTTIEGICYELNDDPDDESLRSLMVGSELALDLLEDGPARKAPLTRGGLTRLALKLLSSSSGLSARLAGVCQEETRYIYAEDLRSRLVESDVPDSLAALECLTYLVDRYGDEFQELVQEILRRRKPSVDEVSAMVEAATGANRWLANNLIELVGRAPVPIWPGSIPRDDAHGQYGPWTLETVPEWLRWYVKTSRGQVHARGRSVFRISHSKAVWSCDAHLVAESREYGLTPPDNMPSGDTWKALELIGEFCSVPSKQSLSAALRGISYVKDLASRSVSMPYLYPWPLAETLLAASTEESRGAVLDAVESGKYGDTVDWLANEQRYLEGIKLVDIVSEPNILGVGGDGLFAFPFRSAYPHRSRPPILDESLIALYYSASNPLIKEFVGSMLLSPTRRPDSLTNSEWLDDAVSTMMVRRNYIIPQFWELMRYFEFNGALWDSAFKSLRPLTISLSSYHRPGIRDLSYVTVQRLVDVYLVDPSLSGLLVPLASCVMDKVRLPELLIPKGIEIGFDDPVNVRLAAAICKVVAGTSVASVCDELTSLYEDTPEFYRSQLAESIATGIIRRGLDYRAERDELMALWHMFSRFQRDLEGSLRGNFLRRPSGIASAFEWQRLNFPSSLRRLLSAKS
jgi:hypothetical protein